MKRVLVSWCSGKDSAWLVHVLRQTPDVEIGGLLTTVNEAADRVAMHAVRASCCRRRLTRSACRCRTVFIPSPCPNDVYERAMGAAVACAVADGFTHVAFGDLFLEDVRRYREERLAGTGLTPLFPLFGADTRFARARDDRERPARAHHLRRTRRCSTDRSRGANSTRRCSAICRTTVDPCGERGEFHTFAYAGPMFARPIPIESGVVVERDGFVFADLVAVGRSPATT